MKVSLVQQLLGQGFTAEQILAMEDDTEQQAAPEQAAPEQAAPEQAAPEQAAPEQAAPEQVPSWANALEASIAALTKTVQGYNRAHDEQPGGDPVNELDKALETYITGKPPAKGGKK